MFFVAAPLDTAVASWMALSMSSVDAHTTQSHLANPIDHSIGHHNDHPYDHPIDQMGHMAMSHTGHSDSEPQHLALHDSLESESIKPHSDHDGELCDEHCMNCSSHCFSPGILSLVADFHESQRQVLNTPISTVLHRAGSLYRPPIKN